jgi:hypothetical protein
LWLFELKLAELPKTAFLSPYIYAVSRIKSRPAGADAAGAYPESDRTSANRGPT